MSPRLIAQIDRFVPPKLRAEADASRRARLLVGFAFAGVPPGILFAVLAVVNYRMPFIAAMSVGTAVISGLAPVVLRRTGSLAVASGVMLTVYVTAILTASSLVGGQALLSLPWLATIPLLATAFAGRTAGVFWAAVSLVGAEAQVYLEHAGTFPQRATTREALRIANGWNILVLVLFVFAFALLYESLRVKAMAALSEAMARLEASREGTLLADRLASLGRMAAGIAHEINNPMTFVSGNVALLHKDLAAGPLDPSLVHEYVDDILPATEDGIRRVIAIVGDLRRFARGETERRVAFDLNDEVRAALRLCEGSLGDCRLRVNLDPLPSVLGNPREIAQVVTNLVINAADAVKRRGSIVVETQHAGATVVLRVRDDGMGMTPQVKARALEPFFTTKPVGEGTGLGLAVVHGIVQAHSGTMQIDTAPQRGTTVEVRLPAGPAAATESSPPQPT